MTSTTAPLEPPQEWRRAARVYEAEGRFGAAAACYELAGQLTDDDPMRATADLAAATRCGSLHDTLRPR